ncbi:hypothetical protein LguiB_016703 [Lonicera macranthoides]
MAKLLMLFALCLIPALASARVIGSPYIVKGCVYCDTCRAGFETSATKYLAGARVRIECKDRDTQKLRYSIDGITDSAGKYSITVADDHQEQMCDAMLVSSPDPECAVPDKGRDRSRVILTGKNGMTNMIRFANAMGFLRDQPMAVCAKVMQLYQEIE